MQQTRTAKPLMLTLESAQAGSQVFSLNGSTADVQDVMRLDNTARMNFPGTTKGNWSWRIGDSDIWSKLKKEAKELKQLATDYDRLPYPPPLHKP